MHPSIFTWPIDEVLQGFISSENAARGCHTDSITLNKYFASILEFFSK